MTYINEIVKYNFINFKNNNNDLENTINKLIIILNNSKYIRMQKGKQNTKR